ncbi:MAG: glycosyltransferase [Lachnospiraceae bacterium]|nr:glycosyltransferase [Lachnospiraceae bacterium]
MPLDRVLLGSPVYQQPPILTLFLESLSNLIQNTIEIDFMFVDDNIDQESSRLLRSFSEKFPNTIILEGEQRGEYICDENTHQWTNENLRKVTKFKNRIIDYARKEAYNYLFLIDSDVIIHPILIEHLKSKQKDIISEIYWTKFQKESSKMPNVWMYNIYDMDETAPFEFITPQEKQKRTDAFYKKLAVPGVYEVGGLGACTLITRKALEKGVNFDPIKNVRMPGEDRSFCIRAAVLGIQLFVDTNLPAYHVYRMEDLAGGIKYKNSCFVREYRATPKLTLTMIVRNESGRYLDEALRKLRTCIDEAVIIDDASTDDTIEIVKRGLEGIPLTLIQNKESMFYNECKLRKMQWKAVIDTNPDWILNLDADEIFEDAFYEQVRGMLTDPDCDLYLFPLYDMWDEIHYREDEYWSAHQNYYPFLMRYQRYYQYSWKETPQHCGRYPYSILNMPRRLSTLRLKHYGWAREEDRNKKYIRYRMLDPDYQYGIQGQIESILDKEPRLLTFIENT